jgi:thiosulfate/3-mercaptopyruvate sulfurtransferase
MVGLAAEGRRLPAVVTPAWLQANLGEVVVVDTRWYADGRTGSAAFASGHIEGAVFVDLDTDLSGPPSDSQGRHPLPEPNRFAQAMASAGISDGDRAVAYDDAGGIYAARLVWMLRVTGHEAALLDGGLAAWGARLEEGTAHRPLGRFTAVAWPAERLASIDDVTASGRLIIDARTAERFRGEGDDPFDPRSGHIPGAISVPCRENLDSSGRFLPVESLRLRFASLGVGDAAEVTAYCGSGVTACHDLLALEWAGLGEGALFVGSWSQWSRDPERPVATGPAPGDR